MNGGATKQTPAPASHPVEAKHVRCPACRGIGTTGWKRWGDDYEPIPCDVCLGNGRILTFTPKHPREALLV